MNRYRTGGHSRFTIYYHIVFCPKYRRKIFQDMDIDVATKEAIKEMSLYHDWVLKEIETDKDHIHIFLSAPPRFSPVEIVKLIKTWAYHSVYKKYPQIKEYLWGGKMWCEGYYISTISDRTTKEEIKRYVREQKINEKQLRLNL